MNPASQFDVHPNAESLNGFVEHQLPEAERAQVLEHLASCGRCRQIVYLAQDAALPAPARVPAVEHRIEDGEHVWTLRSKYAWAAAFAFALMAAIAVFLSMRHGSPATEVAKFAPGAGPAPAAVAPRPPAGETAQTDKSLALLKTPAGNAGARKPRPAPTGSAGSILYEVAPASPVLPPVAQPREGTSMPPATADAKSAAEPMGLVAPGAANSTSLHGSLATREAHFQSLGGPLDKNALAAKASPVTKSELAPAPASATVAVNADQAQLQPEAAGQAQFETIAPTAGAAAGKQSGLAMLPSGLPVVSIVAAGRNIVAIDAFGSLYLSHDFEKSWEPVERQWTGQAVKVRIAQAPGTSGPLGSFAAQKGSPRAKASIAASVPGAIFELLNDSNAVWTSADGKTWKAK
jgi:hypothetical protein